MLETIIVIAVGLLVGVDLALAQRANVRLRKQLLELATQRAAQMSIHAIKIECDNSQAIASLAEVQLAAERAAATLERVNAAAVH